MEQGTRAERIVPMARHWAEVGFGTPVVMHLFYVVKICSTCSCVADRLTTTGIDGFTNVAAWYHEPIVYQRVVFYTMLFEIIGWAAASGPLNNRFFPPMGSILYWLRPSTISAATVAEPDPADPRRCPHAGRRGALRAPCW